MLIKSLLFVLILTFSGCVDAYTGLQIAEVGISIGLDLHEYADEKRAELKRIKDAD